MLLIRTPSAHAEPPMPIPLNHFTAIENNIQSTIDAGTKIRTMLAKHSSQGPYNAEWRWKPLLKRFMSSPHGGRLKSRYVVHHRPRRFNEMKKMFPDPSRILSDKLRFLTEEGLVLRVRTDGPPVKVIRIGVRTEGRAVGCLPLVAHLKMALVQSSKADAISAQTSDGLREEKDNLPRMLAEPVDSPASVARCGLTTAASGVAGIAGGLATAAGTAGAMAIGGIQPAP